MHMTQKTFSGQRQNESGNVLFLILIAVALFAALSYAVTQSSRSGNGSTSRETSRINSAQLTQYPAGVRSAVVRMVIGGIDAGSLAFNIPSDFGNLGANTAWGVFYPDGGGATYEVAPEAVRSPTGNGIWHFNGENQIDLIGSTNAAGPTTLTADIIAFLPDITLAVCSKINDELGLPTTPPAETGIDVTTDMKATGGTSSGIGAGGDTIGDEANGVDAPFDGQPFGCFEQGGKYNYYHVIIER
jgi:hypothetical protein